MDGLPAQLPDDPTALKALLEQQQRTIEKQLRALGHSQSKLDTAEQRVDNLDGLPLYRQEKICAKGWNYLVPSWPAGSLFVLPAN